LLIGEFYGRVIDVGGEFNAGCSSSANLIKGGATMLHKNHMVCEDDRHIFGVGNKLKTMNVWNTATKKYDDLQAICECGNAGFSLGEANDVNEITHVTSTKVIGSTTPIKAVKSYTIAVDTLEDLLKKAGYRQI
jgi:hypothetical protein|tara:strand:- start:1124 stop:1525 length:402 start_codon:yes stop_codon:yes gene_type:complete